MDFFIYHRMYDNIFYELYKGRLFHILFYHLVNCPVCDSNLVKYLLQSVAKNLHKCPVSAISVRSTIEDTE